MAAIRMLPLEIQEKILRNVPPIELHSRIRQVCHLWRAIIDRKRNTLPRVPAKCSAVVMEFGEDRFIQFQFSTARKRRIFVGHTLQTVRFSAQIVSYDDELCNCITISPEVLPRILRVLEITHLEVRLTHLPRRTEGIIVSVLQFLLRNMGVVELQEIFIRSDDDDQPWTLSSQCQRSLQSLECLCRATFVNIEGFEWLAEWRSWNSVSELSLRSNCSSTFDQKLNVLPWAQSSRIPNFVLDVSSEYPKFNIDAQQLCSFLFEWASSPSPWMFGTITFNATYGIQKVREFLKHQSNQRIALVTIPQFVYQIPHTIKPKTLIEIKLQVSESLNVKWIITLRHLPKEKI